ncbi:hypothetical protein BT96DRAFT_1019562 [Gymnopus androsaceus JB14]|uniref:Uncharacterized protein n=1 Tax=Gymnopus androsaceus JB14 TaxID=1447944 RepID=A0A6A4HRR7_9AGAR|nr:hypothetical protein BT96DRAFT_1019562 [Gymnopus androsaceus JB14]
MVDKSTGGDAIAKDNRWTAWCGVTYTIQNSNSYSGSDQRKANACKDFGRLFGRPHEKSSKIWQGRRGNDRKEQDGIGQWVRNYRHLFGGKGNSTTKASSSRTNHTGHTPPPAPKPSGPLTINKMIVDSDDEEDADFKLADSEDDGEGSDSAGQTTMGEDEEEEGLKPENHPLLRPGAMPKMSRAAVDMVVGMMEQDLVGGPEEGDDEDELDD